MPSTANRLPKPEVEMKVFFTFVVVFAIYPATLFAGIEKNTMAVEGSVEILAQADSASFSFEVGGKGASLHEAVDRARGKVSKISKSLFKAGLKKKNLRTSLFHSGENTEDKSFLSSSKDYVANITVVVVLDNLDLLETAVIRVSEAKPKSLSDFDFSLKNYEKLRMEALEKAILKAKEKAELLARVMNFKLGDVLSVSVKESISDSRPDLQSRLSRQFPSASNAVVESGKTGSDVYATSDTLSGAGFFARQFKIRAKVKTVIEILGKEACKSEEKQTKMKALIEIEGHAGQ